MGQSLGPQSGVWVRVWVIVLGQSLGPQSGVQSLGSGFGPGFGSEFRAASKFGVKVCSLGQSLGLARVSG